MSGIVGVTLNKPGFNGGGDDAEIERFALLYDAGKSAQPTRPLIQEKSLPSGSQANDIAPRLDPDSRLELTTTVEGSGTRIAAKLITADADGSEISKQTSVLIDQASALAVTDALADILAPDASSALALDDPDLAIRVLEELQGLIESLGELFLNLDLDLFTSLPPPGDDLPDLSQYTFANVYDERLWQMTWATWLGNQNYDAETMFGLSLQSASLMNMGLSFNRDLMDMVQKK